MRFMTSKELADLPQDVSSEERLEGLNSEGWSPQLFAQKATELQEIVKLKVQVVSDASQLPELGELAAEREFRYDHCSYADCLRRQQDGWRFLVSLALKEGQVVGYAIAALEADDSAEIEIIDVADSYRRSSGLKVDLKVQSETFSVGVGHMLVVVLLRTFRGKLRVDATGPSSRYVFKSLGFVGLPGETNPCLLHRLPASID